MTETTAGWAKSFSRGLWVVDSLVIAVSTFVGLWLSGLGFGATLSGSAQIEALGISYGWLVLGVIILWALSLEIVGSRDSQIFARGLREYQRVFNGTLFFFIFLAAASFLFRAEPSRLFIGSSLTIGFLLLLLARFMARRFIWFMRKNGRMLTTVFFVGPTEGIEAQRERLGTSGDSGYRVVGSLVVKRTELRDGGGLEKLASRLKSEASEADLIVVADAQLFSPEELDEFTARLDVIPLALAVIATPAGIALARMRWELESQTNLLRVRDVQLSSLATWGKRSVDVFVSAVSLLLFSPFLLVIALLITVDSRGPVFFRQIRVGQFGNEFSILKFRSMHNGAEQDREKLLSDSRDAGNDVLFKLKNDPRITRVGKFLRRWSIDEVPQLINVLRGEMSLVGPRPPLPLEVKKYEGSAHRRLAVKPGLTGLWQVSGRSDLSWEASVKIDLEYVEKWSPLIDVFIVAKTLPAVLRKKGAY